MKNKSGSNPVLSVATFLRGCLCRGASPSAAHPTAWCKVTESGASNCWSSNPSHISARRQIAHYLLSALYLDAMRKQKIALKEVWCRYIFLLSDLFTNLKRLGLNLNRKGAKLWILIFRSNVFRGTFFYSLWVVFFERVLILSISRHTSVCFYRLPTFSVSVLKTCVVLFFLCHL